VPNDEDDDDYNDDGDDDEYVHLLVVRDCNH
jgi:hypothetical protein